MVLKLLSVVLKLFDSTDPYKIGAQGPLAKIYQETNYGHTDPLLLNEVVGLPILDFCDSMDP